jgi:hypothetical protein
MKERLRELVLWARLLLLLPCLLLRGWIDTWRYPRRRR